MQHPIFHVSVIIGIHISFDPNIYTKDLQHIPWRHFLGIGVELFPLIQISSNNLKHILICWFIHGPVYNPPWVLTQVIL